MPSLASSVLRIIAMRCAVSSMTEADSGLQATARIRSLHRASASGPLPSRASTISPTASSSAVWSGTISCTRPMR